MGVSGSPNPASLGKSYPLKGRGFGLSLDHNEKQGARTHSFLMPKMDNYTQLNFKLSKRKQHSQCLRNPGHILSAQEPCMTGGSHMRQNGQSRAAECPSTHMHRVRQGCSCWHLPLDWESWSFFQVGPWTWAKLSRHPLFFIKMSFCSNILEFCSQRGDYSIYLSCPCWLFIKLDQGKNIIRYSVLTGGSITKSKSNSTLYVHPG